MKKVIILSVISLVGLSACGRRYTCPTYLKDDSQNKTEYRAGSQETSKDEKKS